MKFPPWTSVDEAARLLADGQVVAIPTETVYGLAGNAYEPKALAQIFAIKERPTFDPLIVHICHIDQLKDVAKDILEEDPYLRDPDNQVLRDKVKKMFGENIQLQL